MRRVAILLLALPALLLGACSSDDGDDSAEAGGDTSAAERGGATIEHLYGTTELESTPQRIVSLDTQWTDVLTAMDGPLVGVILDPQIDNGRVIADVEVDNLDTDFIDARVLVELPVAERSALLVPASAIQTRSGIDFVRVAAGGAQAERAVVTGERTRRADGDYVEILTGLAAGDVVVTP